jgi:hypothetical protein
VDFGPFFRLVRRGLLNGNVNAVTERYPLELGQFSMNHRIGARYPTVIVMLAESAICMNSPAARRETGISFAQPYLPRRARDS